MAIINANNSHSAYLITLTSPPSLGAKAGRQINKHSKGFGKVSHKLSKKDSYITEAVMAEGT